MWPATIPRSLFSPSPAHSYPSKSSCRGQAPRLRTRQGGGLRAKGMHLPLDVHEREALPRRNYYGVVPGGTSNGASRPRPAPRSSASTGDARARRGRTRWFRAPPDEGGLAPPISVPFPRESRGRGDGCSSGFCRRAGCWWCCRTGGPKGGSSRRPRAAASSALGAPGVARPRRGPVTPVARPRHGDPRKAKTLRLTLGLAVAVTFWAPSTPRSFCGS
jgi:hypothetical protein